MKTTVYLILSAVIAALASCQYKAPLSEPQGLKLDPKLMGQWESIPGENGGDDKKVQRMLVMPFTKTEYLVVWPTGEESLYFRAYPLELGGVSCVQIEVIGNAKGDKVDEKDARYDVLHYALGEDGKLLVRKLNGNIVSSKLTKSADLQKEFIKHKDEAEFWKEPGSFRKVVSKD